MSPFPTDGDVSGSVPIPKAASASEGAFPHRRRAVGNPPDRSEVDAIDIVQSKQVSVGERKAFGAILSEFDWDPPFGLRHPGANGNVQELTLAQIAQRK